MGTGHLWVPEYVAIAEEFDAAMKAAVEAGIQAAQKAVREGLFGPDEDGE